MKKKNPNGKKIEDCIRDQKSSRKNTITNYYLHRIFPPYFYVAFSGKWKMQQLLNIMSLPQKKTTNEDKSYCERLNNSW